MPDQITVKWGEREVVLRCVSSDGCLRVYQSAGADCWSLAVTHWVELDVYKATAEHDSLGMPIEIDLQESSSAQDACDELESLIRSIPGMGLQWEPIEDAPKDGTEVLLSDGEGCAFGGWSDCGGLWVVDGDEHTNTVCSPSWTHFARVNLPGGE